MNYETVTLDEVSEKIDYGLTTSATSTDTGVKFLRITDIQETGVDWQTVPFCECDEKDFKQYSLSQGDIVFARTGATTGKSFLIKDKPEKTVFASYLIRVRANQKLVDPEFLSYFFQTTKYWQQISDSAVGAAQVGVNGSKLAELKLPLPPLTEQKRIASLLARADRLRQLRRTANELADSLLQSVFLEMFGNPVNNEKGWTKDYLQNYTTLISSGSTPLGGSNVYKTQGYRFIRSQNVLMNRFDFSDIAYIDAETYSSMKRTFVKQNDVLLNITGASIGRVACYQDNIPANVNQHVCIIRCKPDELNPIYLSYLIGMNTFQEKIISEQSGATRQAFTFDQIGDFEIIVPPLSLQDEFAGVVKRVEGLRGRMSESARQGEGLFESLLAQSFGTR